MKLRTFISGCVLIGNLVPLPHVRAQTWAGGQGPAGNTRETASEAPSQVLPGRFADVILLKGNRLERLLGRSIAGIRLMAWRGQGWEPVPFQIDEKTEDGRYLYPFGPENDQDKLDGNLDPWDELVFMARDAGPRAAPSDWPPGYTSAEEVGLFDPLTGKRAWVYLFWFPEPPPLSPEDLIRYDPDYDRFYSKYYVVGYSRVKHQTKAVMEYYCVPKEAGGTGVNWFDSAKVWIRIRLFFSLVKITIHSDDWNARVPAYIDGPIRVIKKTRTSIRIGFGLHTPHVDADLVYYPHFFMSALVIAIPFDPSLLTSSLRLTIGTDLNHHATGMLFWNSENPEPVIVDGRMSPQEKAMDLSPDRWRVVSGPQGKYMGKAVYAGNFKLSNIKLDEGRYVDDFSRRDPPEHEQGMYGSYNWTWDITNGKRGKYVVWMEAYYGPGIKSEDDLRNYLNVTDHPLHVLIGESERLNCPLIPPPGFTEAVLPEAFREELGRPVPDNQPEEARRR